MTIQIPNPGTGNGASGDNEFVLWSKVKDNFSDTTHAANKLVGEAAGNVMTVGAFGLGSNTAKSFTQSTDTELVSELAKTGSQFFRTVGANPAGYSNSTGIFSLSSKIYAGMVVGSSGQGIRAFSGNTDSTGFVYTLWTDRNATKDSNGFLKGASPVIDMYDNKIDLNQDAIEQGGITFEKLGVGDYLIKGSLGFAQEGWYIEMPKDANGNVLVAVVYEQLENNDLSIKTYAKRFDEETGDIIPNTTKPRSVPDGRFISLRLHELPKEPPVMPTETQTEV